MYVSALHQNIQSSYPHHGTEYRSALSPRAVPRAAPTRSAAHLESRPNQNDSNPRIRVNTLHYNTIIIIFFKPSARHLWVQCSEADAPLEFSLSTLRDTLSGKPRSLLTAVSLPREIFSWDTPNRGEMSRWKLIELMLLNRFRDSSKSAFDLGRNFTLGTL